MGAGGTEAVIVGDVAQAVVHAVRPGVRVAALLGGGLVVGARADDGALLLGLDTILRLKAAAEGWRDGLHIDTMHR